MGGALSWIQKRVMADEEPPHQFPTTLDGFGYYFNKDGQMRQKETDKPFEFNVKEGDYAYNQQHYNALGEVITETVYQMLEKDCKLQRSYIPINAEDGQPRSFVFISGDLYTNASKLMILIHGNGVVRAGQWARRLIMNDCLDSGTQLPYVRWAREQGYAVIVANPNLNHAEPVNKKKKPIPIQGNSTPEEHMETVWREFVQRCNAKHVAIVAHSYGGVSTLELAKNHLREFEERVFAIALTDSVHGLKQQEAAPEVIDYYKQHVVNWASAYDPLDAPLTTSREDVPTVSAGTDKHEYTSFSSMHSIFKFFTEKYAAAVNPKRKNSADETTAANPKSEDSVSDATSSNDKPKESVVDETTTHSSPTASNNDQPTNEILEKAVHDQSESSSKVSDQSNVAMDSDSLSNTKQLEDAPTTDDGKTDLKSEL